MAVATASAEDIKGGSPSRVNITLSAADHVFLLYRDSTGTTAKLPRLAGPWSLSDSTWEGVYTFNHDGKGTFKGIYRVIERTSDLWPLWPNPTGNDIPYATAANVSWNFEYTLSKTGRITFTYSKGSYLLEWLYGPGAGTELY